MIEIENRFNGKIIFRSKRKTLKEAIEYKVEQDANLMDANLMDANLMGADLEGADLEGANLWGANLWGANLWGANLRDANLRGAHLEGADLRDANLWGANLRGADLRVKNPPVNSHQFISEVLSLKASTESQWDFTARIRLQTDQCWGFFIKLARKKKVLKWAKEILFQWDEFKEKFKEESEG